MIRRLRAFACVLALCGASHAVQAQTTNWVDQWFTSSTSTGAGHYESQQRGFYTLGSFQGRWRMSNDYLLSASPPRLKIGCGGIDAFAGAFSYLDPEFLVQKLERMIQAAPAFAFDLALQELCKPCVTSMQAFEQITDQLNQIQLNDCQMSKRVVHAVMDPDQSLRDEFKQEAAALRSVGDSIRKNWQAFQDAARATNGTPPDDVKPLINGCSTVFRDVFTGGSVVRNTAALVGLEEYADLIRGLIGDAIVTPAATQYVVERQLACAGNDQLDINDLLTGNIELKGTDDRCRPSGEARVLDVIEARLTGIASRIASATALTADAVAFIENASLPVYALIRDAVIAGTVPQTIQVVREPLAVAYAYRILDDLLKASDLVIQKAAEVERDAKVDGTAAGRCETTYIAEAIQHVKTLSGDARQYRQMLHQNYTRKTTEFLAQLQAKRELYEQRKRVLGNTAATMQQ